MDGGERTSWLCPTPLDRERLIDMNARVANARRVQGGVLGAASVVAAPFAGLWLLGLVALAGAILVTLERVYRSSRRPELVSVTSIVLLELVLTGAAAGTGGATSPLLGWLCVPLVMLAARFRPRVVAVGVGAAAGCALLAEAISSALPPAAHLPLGVVMVCWLALAVSLIAAVMALLTAELQSRTAAVIDPLTALPNRLALAGRIPQVVAQAELLDLWVSVIMCDLDHFKAINDTHGHDAGDHVLRAVAYEMRRALRSFDAVYRLGGEEFLVLLPGVEPADALLVADRLRGAVAGCSVDGIRVTMSAGVAGARGAQVLPETLTREADQALYTAKRTGRNRSVTALSSRSPTAVTTA